MEFTIKGELTDLNNYISAMNKNRYAGNSKKQQNTHVVALYARKAKQDGLAITNYPITLEIDWYVPNRRKDPDNIAFAKKYILDGMQQSELIRNDGFKEIAGWTERFHIDKDNPRVVIKIKETV